MLKQILKLTRDLIAIPSTSDNKKALSAVLERALIELSEFTVERFESNKIPSLLVYNRLKRPKKFKLILNGHLDVVPGKPEQYRAVEKSGKLYGRGSDDMKAATAVLILVFKELAAKVNYPLALQLVTDEEVGGANGVKYQIKRGVLADFFITGETTQFNIKNEAKGLIWATISAHGKTSHGAYPWRGQNALWELKPFLDKLQRAFPVPTKAVWQTTVNLAAINTPNQTFNKVPDAAEVKIDIRYIPSEVESVKTKLKRLLPANLKLEFAADEPFHYTDPKHPDIALLRTSIDQITQTHCRLTKGHGVSDAHHYSEKGITGVEFGPIGTGLHSDNEWVDIQSLSTYHQILQAFLLSL